MYTVYSLYVSVCMFICFTCITVGTVPADIGKLTILTKLSVDNNKLTGWYSLLYFLLILY